jgi:hypothetical protein
VTFHLASALCIAPFDAAGRSSVQTDNLLYINHNVLLCCCCSQTRASALESELRKSKRAEQKLQALLYRLRQDVAGLGSNPSLFDNLQDVRNLEYEVDFLTNKCKVRRCCWHGGAASTMFQVVMVAHTVRLSTWSMRWTFSPISAR